MPFQESNLHWHRVGTGGDSHYTARRCFVWSGGGFPGGGPVPAAPSAGGDIDGVSGLDDPSGQPYYPAHPGLPVPVEAGGTFSAGNLLEVLADGRVQLKATGLAVMKALENATAGQIKWAVFTSGR